MAFGGRVPEVRFIYSIHFRQAKLQLIDGRAVSCVTGCPAGVPVPGAAPPPSPDAQDWAGRAPAQPCRTARVKALFGGAHPNGGNGVGPCRWRRGRWHLLRARCGVQRGQLAIRHVGP